MRPSQAILALEKLRESLATPLYRKGVELSLDDNRTVMDVYQQWLLLIMDLGYLQPEDLLRTGRRLWADMVRVDVLTLNSSFAECLQLVRLQSDKGFKALCSQISPHLYALLKDDIRMMIYGDTFAAKRLVQAFAYTSRLTLKDIDLTQQMLEEYLAIEDNISDELPIFLVRRLNYHIRRWMKYFDPSRIRPQHGQHGVAFLGRTSLENKYKNLTSDQMLEYAFGEPWWSYGPIRSTLDRISHTIFVPKSYKTFRTISMEPPTLMYFQQGVWKELDRLVARNSYLRNRIDFHTQERNQKLAREGSICRNWATIDLSSASDSVSHRLVKELFRGTKLLRFLVATRSKKTLLPDGRLVELKKFAPMGSALCFPIETIIFAAVCEHVTGYLGVPGKYSVYGDDIIVPTETVDMTMRVLESLGFRVNREKSFYQPTCWFRESCGGEFVDGHDITPMRVSRKYSDRERDVRLEALIDSANNAYKRNYRNLRAFFLHKMREFKFVPLFAPTSILSDNYTNYHTEKRWNRKLQRIEIKVKNFDTHYRKIDLSQQDESIRYRHWLESTFDRNHVEWGFESVVCQPTRGELTETWREKPYEDLDQVFIDSKLGRG